jgi:ParB-like chromosome segregation protein Spo0J
MSDVAIADDIERRPVDEIIPYSNNPKEHPDEQVKKIASSIKNYGWDQPIVVDEDNEIIKGHGRLQAAELLGLDTVPVIRRDDLTDAEKRASRIADNKTAESPWDDDVLTVELEDVAEGFDAEALGYDDEELDDLIGELDVPEFDPVDKGEQPALDEETGQQDEAVRCPDCGNTFSV